jgi:hypothetical protein
VTVVKHSFRCKYICIKEMKHFVHFVDFSTHWTHMLIFRRIFLSNYWWQKSDIWSQASYRYPVFNFPTVIRFKQDELWANAHLLFGKQEVGIWRVKKRFPRYGVPIWSLWPNIRFLSSIVAEKNDLVAFFSATIDGRGLIFGHKLYIGAPYRGKRFWTHQIPTSCLPTLLIEEYLGPTEWQTEGQTEGWVEGRTDRRTEVKQYTPSTFGERGYSTSYTNVQCTSQWKMLKWK